MKDIYVFDKPEQNDKIGKQRIIEVDTNLPFLGAGQFCNQLILMTADALYQIKMS